MTRYSLARALLLAAAMMFAASCTDDRSTVPTAIPRPSIALDREHTGWAPVTIVRGTGNPDIDVAAVQAAVDQGGFVRLIGHFSFDAPPSSNNAIAADLAPPVFPSHAEIKITKSVNISGGEDEDEDQDLATIDGGMIPFYVEAPGQAVSIRRLRFVRPVSHAILIFAVQGLEIASNRIEGLKTFSPNLNGAIGVYTIGTIPNATKPGKPGNVTGSLVIADNDFDVVGGTAAENVLGITVFSVGDSATPVEARISGNRISNTTEPAINFRRVVGHVTIDHNAINTGTVGVPNARVQAIRVANLGTYVIAHNVIDCQWAGVAEAQGIGVFSQISAWPIENALVEHNRVTMSPPAGTIFDPFSAAIGVYGFANTNVVRHNEIRGAARAGITMPVFPLAPQLPAAPGDNVLARNNFDHFRPSVADMFIGEHALNTRIIGRGTVLDQGDGTVIIR